MRFLTDVLVAAVLASGAAVRQDWAHGDGATVRLKASAFTSLSVPLRQELERRGCVVPQSYADRVPHNVIRGRFTSGTQTDVAVLCSKARTSSILVFRGGSVTAIAELASRPDSEFLQVIDGSGGVGYSRLLRIADPTYIQQHRRRYGGPALPLLDHDGINDIFAEKGRSSGIGPAAGGCSLRGPTELAV